MSGSIHALGYLPPFCFERLASWWAQRKSPRRPQVLGDPDFDRFYVVEATSVEVAATAVPPALRAHLLEAPFRGTMELRPGIWLCSVSKAGCDVSVLAAVDSAEGILAAASRA